MIKVLIVDDDARNVRILEETLEEGFITASAGSGEQALEQLSAFNADVVLLDIMMPGIDGLEVCRRIRALPEHRHVKIILVSGKAMFDERLAGFAAGADDYLTKPFDHTELLAKVRVYADLKRAVEADELKTRLLELLVRETQAPLAAVLEGTARLASGGASHDGASRAAAALRDYIGKIPAVSRLGHPPVQESVACDLHACASAAAAELHRHGRSEWVRIERGVPCEKIVQGNPWLLQHAIAAVLEDALERSAADKAVQMSLDSDDAGRVRVRIRAGDSVQSPAAREPQAGVDVHGDEPGFRLSLARGIVERQGGNLLVDRGIGGAQTVSLLLPSAKEPGCPL